MKTIKEVAEIFGVSIAALRYYDEIGLLKPAGFTDAGYRLYDEHSLEELQQILFFRELQIPLVEIRNIMKDPTYDREQVLRKQKSLLEKKRDHINGIIELITDMAKGVNTMSFETFSQEDLTKITAYFEQNLTTEKLPAVINFLNEQGANVHNMDDIKRLLAESAARHASQQIKWYGGKEKAMALYAENKTDEPLTAALCLEQMDAIYGEFMKMKDSKDSDPEKEKDLVDQLAQLYKEMFHLENARAILLDLANEYLDEKYPVKPYDEKYGAGCSEFAAYAIRKYYGV